jgi:hypothetical protein
VPQERLHQAFSHIGLITAAWEIDKAKEKTA